MVASRASALNEAQQRRLTVTCQYIDRLLNELEHAFVEAQSNSPFGRYAGDLAPAEKRLAADYIARLRTELVRMLDGQGLSPAPHRVGLRHSLLTHLAFIDVAVEELKPQYMQGYGDLAPGAAAVLNGTSKSCTAPLPSSRVRCRLTAARIFAHAWSASEGWPIARCWRRSSR